MQDWEQCRRNVPGDPEHYMVQTFHINLNLFKYMFRGVQCYSKLGNRCFTVLFDGAYFLLAIMVEGDESSWLRMAN